MTARFLAGLILAAAAALPAQDLDGKWWKNSQIVEEVGLTAEQTDQIEKVFVRTRPMLIDLRADLEKKQFALQQALEDKAAGRPELERKMEAVEDSRLELQKTRARMLLDIRQVLQPGQWRRLVQMRQRLRERVQDRREMRREQSRSPGRKPPPDSER